MKSTTLSSTDERELNLVEVPSVINKRVSDDVKYGTVEIPYGEFSVLNSPELSYVGDYDISGSYNYTFHHKTTDILNYPVLLNYDIGIDLKVKSNTIQELKVLAYLNSDRNPNFMNARPKRP